MTYTFTCAQGHEPETLTVDAENDDEAMEKMMAVAKTHLAEKHTGTPEMSDEDMKGMISANWQKA